MSERERIAEAITETFGERCSDFAPGCAGCQAWAEYDRLRGRLPPEPDDSPTDRASMELWPYTGAAPGRTGDGR